MRHKLIISFSHSLYTAKTRSVTRAYYSLKQLKKSRYTKAYWLLYRMLQIILRILLSLLSLLFLISSFASTDTTKTFYNIGIFSSCLQKSANRSQFNALADSLNKIYEDFLEVTTKLPNFTVPFQYDWYDVCESFEKFYQVIEKIALDKRYLLRAPFNSSYTENSIFIIFVFLPERMTRLLKVTFSNILIYEIDFELLHDGRVEAAGNSDEVRFTNDLVNTAQKYKWEDLYLVSIKNYTSDNNLMYHDYFQRSIDAFRALKTCIHYSTVDLANEKMIDDIFKVPWIHNRKSAVVLFGAERYQAKLVRRFISYFRQHQFPVVLHNLMKWEYYQLWRGEKVPFVTIADFRFFGIILASSMTFSSGAAFLSLPNFLKREMNSVLTVMFNDLFLIDGDTVPVNETSVKHFLKLRSKTKKRHKKFNLVLQGSVRPNATYCPNITCEPGHYKVYGNTTKGFAWKCIPCPDNHIKRFYGNSGCVPCTGVLSIDNGIRTRCVDPYKKFYVEIFNEEFVAVFSLSAVGVLSTLFSMVVFVLKRNTPIVTTSDFVVSIIQMSITCLIFVVTPLPFLKNASSAFVCTWRTLNISVLYALNIGIQFIKSQKLLNACRSKIRLSGGTVSRTSTIQVFTVFILFVSVNVALLVALLQTPPEVSTQTDQHDMLRMHFCNTVLHSNLVMGLCVVIQLMCFVQAFRGRHLPSVMNDAVMLTFTTLIVTIVFTISYGITHFRMPIDKDVFQLGAVILNSFIISTSMYGQKAIRMILYPGKNTRTYFRNKTFNAIRQ